MKGLFDHTSGEIVIEMVKHIHSHYGIVMSFV